MFFFRQIKRLVEAIEDEGMTKTAFRHDPGVFLNGNR